MYSHESLITTLWGDVLFEPNAMLRVRAKRDYASVSLFLFIRGEGWQPEGNGLGKVRGLQTVGLWTPQPVSLFLLLFFWFAMPSPCPKSRQELNLKAGSWPKEAVHCLSPWNELMGTVGIVPATSGCLIELNYSLVCQQHPELLLLPLCHCWRIPLGSNSDFNLSAITIWNNKKK